MAETLIVISLLLVAAGFYLTYGLGPCLISSGVHLGCVAFSIAYSRFKTG